ncbi:MAG TPA: hypothetical protein VH877_14005 [Polyangia bacterium]|jgi:hypothetical protein|nr:hypothetical protein [Polyangia bacterium]
MSRKHPTDDPDLITTSTGEPGATPGQAEGPRDADEVEPDLIGRTAGQAEGERDLVEDTTDTRRT